MTCDILQGDVRQTLRTLPEKSIHCCVTSPPYWGLRDYGCAGQLGLEQTPEQYIAEMVAVFAEVRRVLRDDGTLWLNVGDSYASAYACSRVSKVGNGSPDENTTRPNRISGSLKEKDLCMIPWRLALALQADGWWLRSVIVWHKRSPMPESVTDRPTSSWEPIFLLAKSERYYYDHVAVRQASAGWNGSSFTSGYDAQTKPGLGQGARNEQPTANLRNVWTLSAEPCKEAHFATFPSEIPHRAIAAGTSERGCCPTCGAPWERITTEKRPPTREVNGQGPHREHGLLGGARFDEPIQIHTTGWQPTCAHGGEPIPATVLDPFGGSGTTGLEAVRMGRRAILCELNPAYVEIIRKRLAKVNPLFALPIAS